MLGEGGIAPPRRRTSPRSRRLPFLGATPEAKNVTTFRFDRSAAPFDWRPGQFLEMTFPGLEDPRGPTRPFTISSSPTEAGVVAITTRSGTSPFKQRLHALPVGELVDIEAPSGNFVLQAGRPAILLAGGIGVTPFRSMLRYATDVRLEKPLVLVYASKTPEDLVFRDELDDLARRNHAIRLLETITRPEESHAPWTGHVGRVDADLLRQAMRGVRHPMFYIAGPPGLVSEDRRLVREEMHISVNDVKTDVFDGY